MGAQKIGAGGALEESFLPPSAPVWSGVGALSSQITPNHPCPGRASQRRAAHGDPHPTLPPPSLRLLGRSLLPPPGSIEAPRHGAGDAGTRGRDEAGSFPDPSPSPRPDPPVMVAASRRLPAAWGGVGPGGDSCGAAGSSLASRGGPGCHGLCLPPPRSPERRWEPQGPSSGRAWGEGAVRAMLGTRAASHPPAVRGP